MREPHEKGEISIFEDIKELCRRRKNFPPSEHKQSGKREVQPKES
jgi:hypothetical protein